MDYPPPIVTGKDMCTVSRYTAIPFHMLKYVNFRSHKAIEEMTVTFKVTEIVCEYRLNHILRNSRENHELLYY